jgi:molybdopterin molybdotransferase
MIRAFLGLPRPEPVVRKAVLSEPVEANGPRAHYMRARISQGAGLPGITAFERQDSALLSVLAEADALLIRPVNDGPRARGEIVNYIAI